ncbi:MAG: glutamate--tRNA ligase [Calditrichaeota bacterium]|nr:glutamate--tRNA ligase [Calditrichota bacterium]MCB9391121.1 glutamate--tRNA ligase [Calditrichota bacterium]
MSKVVRTRYAPSPTGYLHVGGLRTALYNYLFARKHGGQLLLRVEDTDRMRLVEGAVENFLDIFDWLGIEFDESPRVGGPHAPYVQSERLALYHDAIATLKEEGHAYPCFCTPERLEKLRSDQQSQGVPPMYDGHCRTLSADAAQARIAAGEPHVWRMAIPKQQTVEVNDLIRGSVTFDSSTIDDQVLLKSDGFPTYHLANVVDDHDMRISHVIRGEEWLPSTPKHVLLYSFFGWEVPQFAHLPLLLNPDRTKMSKRSGDVAVEAYREKGILPEALINFVALLGWHPQDEREMFSLNELVGEFELERVNKAGAVFDQQKLNWMNTEYLSRKSDDETWDGVAPHLSDELQGVSIARVRYAVSCLRQGAVSYLDLAEKVSEAFRPSVLVETAWEEAQLNLIAGLADRLSALPAESWNEFEVLMNEFKSLANSVGASQGLKGKGIWMTLRLALTGREHGPELGRLVGMWGREDTLNRLHAAVANMTSRDAQ